MTTTGQCHCGAIRYKLSGEPQHHTLCHCTDCRRAAGAPMVGWAGYPADALNVTRGEAKVYSSSEHARRHFCGECGTGLFYYNEVILPGTVDVQTATLDDPDAVPPQAQIQVADRISWMKEAHSLPEFERYPPME